jgi:hypothetical protein
MQQRNECSSYRIFGYWKGIWVIVLIGVGL